MSTFIDYIKIKNNNSNDDDILYPITREKAILDDSGIRLDYKIDDITQKCENVEKKIHLVQTAKGTPNEIILDNIKFVEGFYTNFIIIENNDGLTTINKKPLYKPNTTQSPTLIKGKAVTAWYNSTNDCFFIKDYHSKIELPDNLVYFSGEDLELVPQIPRDSDLLGGKPRTYYEQLVQDVADRVTANLNSINVLNNKLTRFVTYYLNTSYETWDVDLKTFYTSIPAEHSFSIFLNIGAIMRIDGFKADAMYGAMTLMQYDPSGGVLLMCSMLGGMWTSWISK